MFHKTVLNNGIRIVTEEINQVRSVSLGIWVQCGARDEEESSSGICHFLEHMLFKGTTRRTAFDIASAIDSTGGFLNAFTSKELTAYYLKVPDYRLVTGIELLADMFNNSLFDRQEIEKEKSVILQEICLLEDTPDEYVHDFFESSFWAGQSLGRAVMGNYDSVVNFSRENLVSFLKSRYVPQKMVVAAVGNMQHEVLVKLIEDAFGGIPSSPGVSMDGLPVAHPGVHLLQRDLEQVHLIVGGEAPAARSQKRYGAMILNIIVGGCMSSRLFQEIREKRGLAYAVNSYISTYLDTGVFGVYVGAGPPKIPEVVDLIKTELERLREVPVTEREISSAKELIKGNYLLSMESTDSRMTRLAKNEVCFGRYISGEEFIDQVEQVSREDVRALAGEIFAPGKLHMVALGNVEEAELIDCHQE